MCLLLKKPFLDLNILVNFCSVPHLPFWGKKVEKVVALQIQKILKKMDYLDTFQSRFRAGHGIKTALVLLLDDLWQQQDGGSDPSLLFLILGGFGIFWADLGSWGHWHSFVLVHLFLRD